jgi:hypothetical protein
MRKLIALLALAVLVTGPGALAKERNVTMTAAPVAPKVGQSWRVTIVVKMDGKLLYSPGKTPALRIISPAGRTITVRSTPTSRAGIYRARIVFPKAGTWRVLVVDRMTGRAYEFNPMKVRAA